jgi:hypothetical protein
MIIDRFHHLYNATFLIENSLLKRIKLPAVLRLVISQVANVLIPLVVNNQTSNLDYRLNNVNKKQTDCVVSLTSFPKRIGKVHLVIESIFRQTYCPSRVILWLSVEQFPSLDVLPSKLLNLRDRGLEIILTEGDLRSYKKYYFLLKEAPKSNFIIIDDDVFYQSHLIEHLINVHKQHPQSVCANRCAVIQPELPYADWVGLSGKNVEKRQDLLPTGCGGVLYPSSSLHDDALNAPLFSNICADADDIWLNCCAFLQGSSVVYTGKNEYLLSIKLVGNEHLHSKNVGESNNDKRIASVRAHYLSESNIDVFDRKVNN